MEVLAAQQGRRRGRWLVLGLLTLGLIGLGWGIVDLSTQKPNPDQVRINGIEDALQIFGGVQAAGDRIGPSNAPVSIEWFDDLQCSSCRQQFLATIPSLVTNYVRPGEVRMDYRHYSFGAATEELGFYGAEAAADQGYTWPYVYLFFRNQGEAKRFGVDRNFLTAVAGAIPELDVPQWRSYLDSEGGPSGQIGLRLAAYDKLATGLGIRARPAAIVRGPNGSQTLQDGPTLAQITGAVDSVR